MTVRKSGLLQARNRTFLSLRCGTANSAPFHELPVLLNSFLSVDDPIVAIASPSSPAARGVVRISGERVAEVLNAIGFTEVVSRAEGTRLPHRVAGSLSLGGGLSRVPVDLLFWPTKRSYTGQPSAELHTFGSLPILQSIVEACCDAGARPARPGEFTMRAFLAGRLDLTQAEAVLGVIEAELPGSLHGALEQLAGNLSKPLGVIRDELLNLLADVEAGLDFVDEDIEFIADDILIERLTNIHDQVSVTADQMNGRELRQSVTHVAFRGEPNAGKSSLLNAICGSQVAIVSNVAGTTRDVVTARIEIAGHSILLQDTAGQEPSDDLANDNLLTRQAQEMASRTVFDAKVRLWCVDANRADFSIAKRTMECESKRSVRKGCIDLFVATKMDRLHKGSPNSSASAQQGESHRGATPLETWIGCSAETDLGVDDLVVQIGDAIKRLEGDPSSGVIGTAARCRESLGQAAALIRSAIDQTRHQSGHEFVSADLRSATSSIGEVTGEVYNEDILDRIFGRFCIGK